jgi:hypothetical protein
MYPCVEFPFYFWNKKRIFASGLSKIVFMNTKRKEEFGKWVMDVAKYVATAVILTSIFSDITQKWLLFIVSGVSVIGLLVIGMSLISKK